MRRLLFLLLVAAPLFGQTLTNAECYFDTDPGQGNGIAIAVANNDTTLFSGPVSITGVNKGLHRLYLRYRENNGSWGAPDGEYFYAIDYAGRAVQGAEAYFDTDPGVGNGYQVSLPSQSTVSFLTPFPTTGMTTGLHRLYVRYRRNGGVWGAPDGEWFWMSHHGSRVLTAAECFYDNDPGQGNGIPVSVPQGQVTNFVGAVQTTGVNYGLHKFYIRYRDQTGLWGSPDGEFFYAIDYAARALYGAECYFDNDPGKGSGIPLSFALDDTANLVVPINTNGLQPGLHRFYIRFKRNSNVWGEPNGAFFFIPSTPGDGDPDQATLSGAEYYVNWDPGEGNGVALFPADGGWDEPIEQINQILGTFPAGRYWLGMRYRDSAGLWSNVVMDTFYVSTRAVIKAVGNNITLWWQAEPGTQFSVFRAPSFEGPTVAVGSSTNGTLTDPNIVNIQPAGFYVVTQSDTNFSSIRIPPQNEARRR